MEELIQRNDKLYKLNELKAWFRFWKCRHTFRKTPVKIFLFCENTVLTFTLGSIINESRQ